MIELMEPETPLTLNVPVTIQASAGDGKPPRFEAVGYTGVPMRLNGWAHPVVLDLAGIQPVKAKLPVLREHDAGRVVGHVTHLSRDDRGIVVNGMISGSGSDAREIIANARNDYPWEVSLGSQPVGKPEFLQPGKTTMVNGNMVEGPAYVVRRAKVHEVSLVSMGADRNTSAVIAAKRKDSRMELMEETQTITLDELKKIDATCDTLQAHVNKTILANWKADMLEGRATREEVLERGIAAIRQKTDLNALRDSRPRFNHGAVNRQAEASGTEVLKCAFASRISPDLAVKAWGEATFEASRPYANMTMLDFIRAAGQIEGHDMPTNPDRLMKAAASMVHLPEILSEAPRRIIELQLQNAAPTWAGITRTRAATDFRIHRSVRLLSNRGLQKLPKNGEVQHDTLSEETFDWQIDTYAKQVQLNRADVINDDLGAFDMLPTIFAADSMASISDVFYTVLNAGQTASFFASGNHNLLTGGTTNLQGSSFATAVRKLREMTDVKGRLLNLQPGTLVVPPALETVARQILQSATLGVTDGSPNGNVWNGAAKLEIEGRIGAAGGGSDTNWYLFASEPGAMQTAFLNATTPQPVIDFKNFQDDLSEVTCGWRILLDHGSARGDSRLAIKSAGA
jgi:hypothetical protein